MKKRPHLIPALIAAIMLLGALADLPYGYYQLLRWVTCGVAVYVAFAAYSWQKMWAVWLFGFITLLFNPLIPIHLSRELWQPIDIICALLFGASAVFLKKPAEQTLAHPTAAVEDEVINEVMPEIPPEKRIISKEMFEAAKKRLKQRLENDSE